MDDSAPHDEKGRHHGHAVADPEPAIVSDTNKPGTDPVCGTTLEPLMPSLDEKENPELVDFRRRFWAGYPFFQRGAQSILHRSQNMWTLICTGVAAACGYSVVATLRPDFLRRHL
jgi:Cu+-exporting ATPase